MFFQLKQKPTQLNHPTFDRMNKVLPFVPAVRVSSDPGSGLYSDHMLAELLALQEGMIAQLRLERLKVTDPTNFLTDMIDHFFTGVIDQHEKTAAMLRTQLENHPAETTNDGLIIITSEDSSDAETLPSPRFA
jgi:hypothetical protein